MLPKIPRAGWRLTLVFCYFAWSSFAAASGGASYDEAAFGKLSDGREARVFTLRNELGMEARITDYGATLISLMAPDREGRLADVVLGHDTLADYEAATSCFGATIGRYANRIARGVFELDGKRYELTKGDDKLHALHGGEIGFHKRLWQGSRADAKAGAVGVAFSYRSPDGEMGFPGNLDVTVTYYLTDDGALEIEYGAAADRPTLCNLTNHSYFNLAGHGSGDVKDHYLEIPAEFYTAVDDELIPTGEILSVAATVLDFRREKRIGEGLDSGDPFLEGPRGYDHNYVLPWRGDELGLAASLREPSSGRVLEVWTTEPGLQYYTGNWLGETGKGDAAYEPYSALCLETQHYPDSPNQPHFPSTVLRPGERYHTRTVFRFLAK